MSFGAGTKNLWHQCVEPDDHHSHRRKTQNAAKPFPGKLTLARSPHVSGCQQPEQCNQVDCFLTRQGPQAEQESRSRCPARYTTGRQQGNTTPHRRSDRELIGAYLDRPDQKIRHQREQRDTQQRIGIASREALPQLSDQTSEADKTHQGEDHPEDPRPLHNHNFVLTIGNERKQHQHGQTRSPSRVQFAGLNRPGGVVNDVEFVPVHTLGVNGKQANHNDGDHPAQQDDAP